jgi:hypothetical protein
VHGAGQTAGRAWARDVLLRDELQLVGMAEAGLGRSVARQRRSMEAAAPLECVTVAVDS